MEATSGPASFQDLKPAVEHRHWQRSVYVVIASQFLVFVGFSLVIPFVPLFIQELGVHDRAQIAALAGLQQTASSIGLVIFSPIWGLVGDRIGRKPMFLRAVSMGALLIALTSAVQTVPQLLALRFLIGAFTGVQAPAMALVSTLAPRHRVGYVVGLIQMAVFSGQFAGPLAGGLLADALGFRRTSLLGGAILGAAALGILLFVHESFAKPPSNPSSRPRFVRDVGEMIRAHRLLPLLATIFCISFAVQGLPPIMPLFIQRLPSLPASAATLTGIALGTAGLCSAVAAPVLGRLGPRVGYERILVAAAGTAATAAASFLLISSYYPVLAAEVVLGASAGGLMPVAFTLLSLRTPTDRRGAAYGVSSSMSAVGTATGPLSGGLLAAALGIRVPFLVAAAMFLVIISLTLSIRRTAAPATTEPPSPRPAHP